MVKIINLQQPLRSFSLPIEIKELLLKIKEKQEENKKYLGKGYYMEDKEYIKIWKIFKKI